MKEKKLLIVERSKALLERVNVEEQGDSIVLTGLFTSFDQKNRNGRIYESADFLPHIEALREKIESGRLMGELDHPHGFEISLKNVSHVVESLEFDPQQNAVIGKVRLLNTHAGLDAQALVKGGVPLSISSRAAGTVGADGKVKLQELFTYDLVGDPGFANAQLKRVNESYGLEGDDSIDIYDISEDANTDLDPHVEKTADYAAHQAENNENTLKNDNMEDNKQDYILISDFQKYSEHLSELASEFQSAIANIKSEIANMKNSDSRPTQEFDSSNVDNSMIADLVAKEVAKALPVKSESESEDSSDESVAELEAKAAKMEENYSNLLRYTKYLAEMVDKSIIHQDYMVEEQNKMIEHNNYLAENMNKMIEHQDYLAESINDTISYQEYIAEMVDKHIDYTDMLAEEQNKTIAYANYLAENQSKMIDHQDYVVEEVNKMEQNLIEERKSSVAPEAVVESNHVNKRVSAVEVEEEEEPAFDSKKYQSDLNEKLSALISTAKEQYAEAKRREEESLAETKKVADTTNFNLINYIPSYLTERWAKLSDDRKKEILAESKLYVIKGQADAELYWKTRDLRERQIAVQKIDESATAQTPAKENAISEDRLKGYSAKIRRNLGIY